MNLRQLQYFVEVSELESVTKAADAPARRPAGPDPPHAHARARPRRAAVRPQRARHRAHQRRRGVPRPGADGPARARPRAGGGQGAVALAAAGASISACRCRSARRSPASWCSGCTHELPDVSLRVIDGWTGFIIEWLMRGRLDLGVIYDHTLKSDVLRTEPLAAEEHFLVCAPDDRAGAARRASRLPRWPTCRWRCRAASTACALRSRTEHQLDRRARRTSAPSSIPSSA